MFKGDFYLIANRILVVVLCRLAKRKQKIQKKNDISKFLANNEYIMESMESRE